MSFDDIKAARQRIRNSLEILQNLKNRSITLGDAAQAVIAAEEILSAYSMIYDGLYESNRDAEVIGRRCENPLVHASKRKVQ